MTTQESSKNKMPDWVARAVGMLGLVLSLSSILWQIHVYREGNREKVIAKVTIHHKFKPHDDLETITHAGSVSVEVVNVGRPALYLRKVSIEACNPVAGSEERVLYQRASNTSNAVRLEPSAAMTFSTKKWEFDAIPLEPETDESRDGNTDYCVVVQSTRGEILRSPVGWPNIEIIANIKN